MATVRRFQHPAPIFLDTVHTIQALTARMLRGQHLRRVLRSIFQYTLQALILRHGQPPRQPLFGRAAPILGSLMH